MGGLFWGIPQQYQEDGRLGGCFYLFYMWGFLWLHRRVGEYNQKKPLLSDVWNGPPSLPESGLFLCLSLDELLHGRSGEYFSEVRFLNFPPQVWFLCLPRAVLNKRILYH